MAFPTNFLEVYTKSLDEYANTFQNPPASSGFIHKAKFYSIELINLGKIVHKKFAIHFPKSMLIIITISIIANILSGSIFGFLMTGLSCYLCYKQRHIIFSAISVYNENNISEFSSSFEEKQRLVPTIEGRAMLENVINRVKSFFGFVR